MKNIKWQKTKEIGKLKFSILYGLSFSIGSSILFFLLTEFTTEMGFDEIHFIIFAVLVISGPIWAVSFWNQMNKKYS